MLANNRFSAQNAAEMEAIGLTHCTLECKEDALQAAEGMRWLINQPATDRARWAATMPQVADEAERQRWERLLIHQGQADLGLARRGGVNPLTQEPEDSKWIFHYNQELRELYKLNGVGQGEGAKFIQAMDRLIATCFQLCADACEATGISLEPGAKGVLRLLWYDPTREENQVVAASHWDRNTMTVHLCESQGGLWVPEQDTYGPEHPAMRLLPRAHENQVHLFYSAKATAANPARYKAIWHRGQAPMAGVPRYVMVYFFHHTGADLPPDFRGKSRDPVAQWVREAKL